MIEKIIERLLRPEVTTGFLGSVLRFRIPLVIMKTRKKQKKVKMNTLMHRAILYLRAYSRYHWWAPWLILRISMHIVRKSFKNDSIMNQNVKEKAMKDHKAFPNDSSHFHLGPRIQKRTQKSM